MSIAMIQEENKNRGCESIARRTEAFAEALRKERDRLRSELRLRMQNLQSDRVALEDDGPVSHEQFVSILRSDMALAKLKQIEMALNRMRNGEYAVCQECGDCISEKRLRALPWAAYCIGCQDQVRQPAAA